MISITRSGVFIWIDGNTTAGSGRYNCRVRDDGSRGIVQRGDDWLSATLRPDGEVAEPAACRMRHRGEVEGVCRDPLTLRNTGTFHHRKIALRAAGQIRSSEIPDRSARVHDATGCDGIELIRLSIGRFEVTVDVENHIRRVAGIDTDLPGLLRSSPALHSP